VAPILSSIVSRIFCTVAAVPCRICCTENPSLRSSCHCNMGTYEVFLVSFYITWAPPKLRALKGFRCCSQDLLALHSTHCRSCDRTNRPGVLDGSGHCGGWCVSRPVAKVPALD